jgi:hypothetical protein
VSISRDLARGTAFGQHGWWVDVDTDKEEPLAANINRVMDTARADPISGSIPLRGAWCEIEKVERAGAD